MITDRKITEWTNCIADEADRPQRTAAAMKAEFDGNSNQLKAALNGLIDDISGGAGDTFLASDGTFKLPEVGSSANGVKAGGAVGDVYVKKSLTVYDGEWRPVSELGVSLSDHNHDERYAAKGDFAPEQIAHTGVLGMASWIGDAAPYTQTVSVTGVTSSTVHCHPIVSPAPSCIKDYVKYGISCITQGSNVLIFACETLPESDITVHILVSFTK